MERQKTQNSQNNTERKQKQKSKLEDRHYSTLILTINLEQ